LELGIKYVPIPLKDVDEVVFDFWKQVDPLLAVSGKQPGGGKSTASNDVL
jgi:hypothetical protein